MQPIVILLVINAIMTFGVFLKLRRIEADTSFLFIGQPAPASALTEQGQKHVERIERIQARPPLPGSVAVFDAKIDAYFLTQSARRRGYETK